MLCCRRRGMEALLHAGRSSSSSSFAAPEDEELRAASGRAGATVGASRASRTPECGRMNHFYVMGRLPFVVLVFLAHPRKVSFASLGDLYTPSG